MNPKHTNKPCEHTDDRVYIQTVLYTYTRCTVYISLNILRVCVCGERERAAVYTENRAPKGKGRPLCACSDCAPCLINF